MARHSYERAVVYDPATEQMAVVLPYKGLWEVHMDGLVHWRGSDPEQAAVMASKAVAGYLPSVPVRKGGAA